MYQRVTFNNNTIPRFPHQKHFGVVLDSKLEFNIHTEQKYSLSQENLYLTFTNIFPGFISTTTTVSVFLSFIVLF